MACDAWLLADHKAGRRAIIWGVGRPLGSPGMAYWMIACSGYLSIVIFGVTVRICRISRVRVGRSGWRGQVLPLRPSGTAA